MAQKPVLRGEVGQFTAPAHTSSLVFDHTRASHAHARPLRPAALAFVPNGIVLARVRVRAGRGGRAVHCVRFRYCSGTVQRTDRRTDPAPSSTVKHRNFKSTVILRNTPQYSAMHRNAPCVILRKYVVMHRNTPQSTTAAAEHPSGMADSSSNTEVTGTRDTIDVFYRAFSASSRSPKRTPFSNAGQDRPYQKEPYLFKTKALLKRAGAD